MRYSRLAPIAAFAILAIMLSAGLPIAQSNAQPACDSSSSQNVCCAVLHGQATSVGTCLTDAISYSGIGILLSLMIVALAYMLGEMFNIQGLKGWYKTELWETAKSLMLVASIFSLLVIVSGIANALYGGSSSFQSGSGAQGSITTNLLGATGLYSSVVNNYLTYEVTASQTAMAGIIGLQSGVNALKGTSITTWLPIPIPIPIPDIGLFVFSLQFGTSTPLFVSTYISGTNSVGSIDVGSTNSFIIDIEDIIILPITVVMSIQSGMFYFVVYLGLGFFLPSGIMLRSMPFLRGIGGTMIAIAITASIIYPAMLLTVNLPVTNIFNTIFANSVQQPPNTNCALTYTTDPTLGIVPTLACGFLTVVHTMIVAANGATPGGGPAAMAVLLGTSQAATPAISQAYNWGFDTGYYQSFNSIIPALNFVTYDTYAMVLQAFLLVFDLVIGIVVAGAIATALGGKLRLGIGKVKLA
ncbi:MAG TPA: hypothetical protein VMV00_01455 [Candidatus Baltobacteraceae bacterium]|nr:hypothetical protein [Candidatus Baltobacteraceae bacterium]